MPEPNDEHLVEAISGRFKDLRAKEKHLREILATILIKANQEHMPPLLLKEAKRHAEACGFDRIASEYETPATFGDLDVGEHFLHKSTLYEKLKPSNEPPYSFRAKPIADEKGKIPSGPGGAHFGRTVEVETEIPELYQEYIDG